MWDAVADKSSRLGTFSPTGAQADIFAGKASGIAELREAFPLERGQCGSLLALEEAPVCLDFASDPEAFGRLYPKLREGYLLDALEALDGEACGEGALGEFVGQVGRTRGRQEASIGLGGLRLAGDGVVGSGLTVEGELVQLSAYAGGSEGQATRISRPSRRR